MVVTGVCSRESVQGDADDRRVEDGRQHANDEDQRGLEHLRLDLVVPGRRERSRHDDPPQ
jgi:hypothetical protein